MLSEPGSVVAENPAFCSVLFFARQTHFQSYIMIVIVFSIIMCDSRVRERGVRLERINDNSMRRSAVHRLGDLRGYSQGPSVAVQGGSFGFVFSCFARASFELESIRMWLSLSPCALTEMEDLTNVA